MQRSRFLIGAVAGLSVAANVDNLFGRALAQPILPGLPGGADDRVLVVINMQGGNDGLNTVVPHGMPQYYKYRPTLGIAPGDVLQIDKQVGFNPAMTSLKGMFDAGNVAVVQGAGYPGPDHSHFRSTEIWQTAEPEHYESTGWVGRFLDSANLPKDNLFNAVALSPVLPEVMIGRRVDVPAIAALQAIATRPSAASLRRSIAAAACRSARRISQRSRRSKITHSAVRRSSPNSSPATRPMRRTRRRRSAAAWRLRRRSSAAASARG
jgi:uncharacterized protein (DUF1501 family)